MKKGTKVILGIVAFVVVVNILSGGGDNENTKTSDVAPVVSTVPIEPEAPVTPEPVIIPEPVVTPEPILVPEPVVTPEPLPKFTNEETTYLADGAKYNQKLGEYLGDFGNLMVEPKIGDQAWTLDVVLSLLLMKDEADNIKNMSAPGVFKEGHGKYVRDGIDYLLLAIDMIPKAIDDLDAKALETATGYINKFNEAAVAYTVVINEIMK